jgi:transcriptional regulator with XRE-family HTH domain
VKPVSIVVNFDVLEHVRLGLFTRGKTLAAHGVPGSRTFSAALVMLCRVDAAAVSHGCSRHREVHAMSTLAGRIRKARLRAGFSQQRLADRLQVTRGAVANWESANGVAPATERLQRIAEHTGIAFEWLATGHGAREHAPLLDDIPAAADMLLVSDHLELRLLHAFRAIPQRQQSRILKRVEAWRARGGVMTFPQARNDGLTAGAAARATG